MIRLTVCKDISAESEIGIATRRGVRVGLVIGNIGGATFSFIQYDLFCRQISDAALLNHVPVKTCFDI